MKPEIAVKDSVKVNLDLMTATCKGGCHIKYARKLINDYLKENTLYKGAWTVWFKGEKDGIYNFKIDNPYYKMAKIREMVKGQWSQF